MRKGNYKGNKGTPRRPGLNDWAARLLCLVDIMFPSVLIVTVEPFVTFTSFAVRG